MLTIQDCIELSGLSEEEILAIAEHEHVPEMNERIECYALSVGCVSGSGQAGRFTQLRQRLSPKDDKAAPR